jgi:branched-chain amino acid transport system permease protein
VAFYAVGAYTTAKLTAPPEAGGMGLEPWIALPAAIAVAMVAGVVLGAPTLRLRGDYLAIVTLGFGEIVRIVAQNSDSLGATRGINNIPHPAGGFTLTPLPYYWLTLGAVVVSIVMVVRLSRSRVGRSWDAIREDEDAAELMGVPTFKMKLWAFSIGASTGGLAGWIYASKVGYINPENFPLLLSILFLSAVVLGGMGSTIGAITGAFLIAFLPEYLREVAAGETLLRWLNAATGGSANDITEYRYMIFGFALVVVMIFRPQGLVPSRQRARELSEAEGTSQMGAVPQAPASQPEPEGPDAGPDAQSEEAAAAGVQLPDAIVPDRESAGPVLELDEVRMEFGGVVALNRVSLTINAGEIFGLIGPNGAGKTTVFNCVTGVFRPTEGDIRLVTKETGGLKALMPGRRKGNTLVGVHSHLITEAGIARTFQNIRLFPDMTALDNVRVGADARHLTSVPGALFGAPRHRREERTGSLEAQALLDFVGVGHRADDLARNLPYGDQRRLEIARAMATGPAVLLLDEPAAGMNPSEKQALIQLIRRIRDRGLTVLLIEHDMSLVMNVCDRIAVLDFGEKIAEGLPAEIQSNDRVIQAYLGVDSDAS